VQTVVAPGTSVSGADGTHGSRAHAAAASAVDYEQQTTKTVEWEVAEGYEGGGRRRRIRRFGAGAA
jgi:hypothetical protein